MAKMPTKKRAKTKKISAKPKTTQKKVAKRVSVKAKVSTVKGMAKVSNKPDFVSVYIACQDREEALKLSQTLVSEGLVACFNVIENVTSIYKFQGELEKNSEVLLIGKTQTSLRSQVLKRAKALHSYQIPCIVFWPVMDGLPSYFDWIIDNTRG